MQTPKVRSFALADVTQAHQVLVSGATTGKVVLQTAPPVLGAVRMSQNPPLPTDERQTCLFRNRRLGHASRSRA
jgi:hypothetical protein